MTVSTSSTLEFNLSQIALLAYQKAGIVGPQGLGITSAQATHALQHLELIVKTSEARGLFAKSIGFTYVTLVAATSTYTLAGTVLDVIEDGAFIPVGQPLTGASGETPVTYITREKWQGLSAQNATGRPTMYFPDRTGATIVVNVWPIPDSGNAGTIRLQTHRLRADVTDGSKTLDFEAYWQEYFVAELGAQLALSHSMNLARVQYLKLEAKEKLDICRAYSNQRGPQQFVMAHRVGGSRR